MYVFPSTYWSRQLSFSFSIFSNQTAHVVQFVFLSAMIRGLIRRAGASGAAVAGGRVQEVAK